MDQIPAIVGRAVEAMDYSYALLGLTAYGRQERWEDWPPRLAATVGSQPRAGPHQRTSHRPVVST